jgi:hypothetical protein
MKVFRLAAVITLLAGPAYAQQTPALNLIQDGPSKSPEQKAREDAVDKAYKESLRKIPDAKGSSDPWGTVRGGDAAKTSASRTSASKTSASNTSASKTSASAKPKTKTGSAAD